MSIPYWTAESVLAEWDFFAAQPPTPPYVLRCCRVRRARLGSTLARANELAKRDRPRECRERCSEVPYPPRYFARISCPTTAGADRTVSCVAASLELRMTLFPLAYCFIGCNLKNCQMVSVALKSRHVLPMNLSDIYWSPPGHVCPPPFTLYSTTSVPSRQPVYLSTIVEVLSSGFKCGSCSISGAAGHPFWLTQNFTVSATDITLPLLSDRKDTSPPLNGTNGVFSSVDNKH